MLLLTYVEERKNRPAAPSPEDAESDAVAERLATEFEDDCDDEWERRNFPVSLNPRNDSFMENRRWDRRARAGLWMNRRRSPTRPLPNRRIDIPRYQKHEHWRFRRERRSRREGRWGVFD